MKLTTVRLMIFVVLILILAVTLGSLKAEDKPDKTIYTLQDMKPEDQQRAQDLIKTINETLKDLELAQARLDLAQSKITRINEVQLPAIQDSLRTAYNLPKDLWDFNLGTFTFTKKAQTAQK